MVLLTETFSRADIPMFPFRSVALASTAWMPFVVVVVSQL
jgi:hypothetical protein